VNTVLITVRAADLSAQMGAMREWLNEHRCEPSRFSCDQYGDTFAVCLDFSKVEEAQDFKKHFSRQDSILESPIPGNEAGTPNERPQPETMAQVCWWRLMAEEIRAEADEFSSDGAKEAMAQVAVTYDRMAENLERRLINGTGWVHSIVG
jgi:hypothetical protein